MALAQRRVPYAFQRPVKRARAIYPQPLSAAPASPIMVRPRAAIALPSLRASLLVGGTVVALALVYIGGYARMTGANYRKVRIQQAGTALLTQQQLLHSEIIVQTDKQAVAAWAEAHGMVPAGGSSIVVQGGADSGR